MNLLGNKLKAMLGAGATASEEPVQVAKEPTSAREVQKEAKVLAGDEESGSQKGAALLSALNKKETKPPKTEESTVEKSPPPKAPMGDVGGGKKEKKGKAAKDGDDNTTLAEPEKIDCEPTKTANGRSSYSLKQMRFMGMTVFNGLTEFDCPDDVKDMVSGYMRSDDKNRARPNQSRPIPMIFSEKRKSRFLQGMTEDAKRAAIQAENRATREKQAALPASQTAKDNDAWVRGEAGPTEMKLSSRAEMQRQQFENEREQIRLEREQAKADNPDKFVNGVRVDASYHEESDAVMMDMMAQSSKNLEKMEKEKEKVNKATPAWGGAGMPQQQATSSSNGKKAATAMGALEEEEPADARMDAYLKKRLGWAGASAFNDNGNEEGGLLAGMDLGLKLSALSAIDSPDRDRGDGSGMDNDGGARSAWAGIGMSGLGGDGGEDDMGMGIGGFGDLGGGADFAALLGDLGDIGGGTSTGGDLGDDNEAGGDGLGGLGSLEALVGSLDEAPQLKQQPAEPEPVVHTSTQQPAPALATAEPLAGAGAAPAVDAETAAANLARLSPEEKQMRESTIGQTLHHMGVLSSTYQNQLGYLAGHYRHQMATNNGNVDPRLLEQIQLVKASLTQLSAHYVQFTALVNSGAPLPSPPPPQQQQQQQQQQQMMSPPPPQQMPPPQQQQQQMSPQRQQQPPQQQPPQQQPPQQQPSHQQPSQQQAQTTSPQRPAGQSVNVNSLFAAAKKTEAAGGSTTVASGAPVGGRSVNVLSLFAAAAAAEKEKESKKEEEATAAAAATAAAGSGSSSPVPAAGAGKKEGSGFAFHSTGTPNKKKGSAISAASKMKLLQMQKKKAIDNAK